MILDLRFFGFVTKKKMQHPKLDSLALRQYWRETDENKHCFKHGSIWPVTMTPRHTPGICDFCLSCGGLFPAPGHAP